MRRFSRHLTPLAAIGAPAGGTWTPLDLGSALIAWWDAGDHGTARMTDDGAGLISSWTDRKGLLPYTGTTTQRPTWSATAAGAAYAGVTFDGVGNYLTGAMTGFPSGTNESWIAALVDQTSDATNRPLFAYGTTGAGLNRQVLKSTAIRQVVSVQVTSLTDTNAAHVFSGVHFVIGGFNATTLTGFFDGDPTTPATAAVTPNTGTTRGRIAADAGTPSTFGKGAYRHLFVLGPLTTLQRQQLEGWALWDVGRASQLPVGHPYKSVAP